MVPELGLTAGAPAFRLPDGGQYWDYIGAFRLTPAKGRAITVRLYAEDSDSVADKLDAKGMSTLRHYPNSFSLHAMYRAAFGEWQHKTLLSYGRTGFERVKEQSPAGPVLELRPKYRYTLEEAKRAHQAGEEINKPFTKRLKAKDGVPVIED
jgi:hypothetical protein